MRRCMALNRRPEPMSEERHSALGIHALDPQDAGQLLKRRQIVRRARIGAIVVLVLLALGAGRTVLSRMSSEKALEARTTELATQYAKTAFPQSSETGPTLALPGTLQGFVQAPISARASGYLRRWYKDIGSRVEKGELLAEVESPEIDQQLSQAIATRDQTAASLALTRRTVERSEQLRKSGMIAQQKLDEDRNAVTVAQATLAAAEANVARLRDQQGFKRVLAPFAGIVTKRNVDV